MSRQNPHDQRRALVDYSHRVYAKGWVANHDGNLTTRMGPDRYLATPTSFSKGDVTEGDLLVVNGAGEKISGRRGGFSEMALHLAAYEARPDIQAVIHAHPPYATAMSVAGVGIDRPIIAEAVVSIGPTVPLLPFAPPKTPQWRSQVADGCRSHDVLILQNHGVIAFGDDLEQAFLRLELVEHLARIIHHSMAFGGPRYLDEAHLPGLLESRRKAGLGPENRGVSGAQRPPAPPVGVPAPSRPAARPAVDPQQLVALITEEISRLKGS